MMQDAELLLDEAKSSYRKTCERLDTKIDQLKDNERKNDDTIRMIQAEKDALSMFE